MHIDQQYENVLYENSKPRAKSLESRLDEVAVRPKRLDSKSDDQILEESSSFKPAVRVENCKQLTSRSNYRINGSRQLIPRLMNGPNGIEVTIEGQQTSLDDQDDPPADHSPGNFGNYLNHSTTTTTFSSSAFDPAEKRTFSRL